MLHSLCLALAPSSSLAATYFGLVDTGELFASADGGTTWTLRAALPVSDAIALAAGLTSSTLMMSSESGTFYRSSDAGVNWTAVGVVPAADVTALVSYPGRVLLFTGTGSVFSSLDSGSSFTSVGVITASDIVSAATLGSSLFALTATGSSFRTLVPSGPPAASHGGHGRR